MSGDTIPNWRDIPLESVIFNRNLVWNLRKAGYTTAGQLVDAEPKQLAAHVYTLGPVRAQRLRRDVIDKVCPVTVTTPSQRDLHPVEFGGEDSFLRDLLVSVVGTLLALLIAALLLAIVP